MMENTEPRQIAFHDTMAGRKRPFEPLEPGLVKIYSCGPTVYDFAHIGNFRNFIFVDVLRRTLKLFGYKVKHVMNITDIDDKIIRNAAQEGISTTELARRYEKAFFEDCAFLRMDPVEVNPRATEHIPEMIDLVSTLIEKGYTYTVDGSVYFSITRFKDYGKLSRIDLGSIRAGARVDSDEYTKEDVRDFVLWKGHRPGEPYWDTPFGRGRPGWHLECSAMSCKYLGNTFDIHTGAEDLVFPHHENEIAQSEAANGQTFVRYWLHCAFLNMKNQKMSKSLGNIVTVHQLAESGADPRAIRYFLLSVHYRKPLLFAEESIEAARSAVTRLNHFYRRLADITRHETTEPVGAVGFAGRIADAREAFMNALADDLNTAKALGAVFELVRDLNPAIEAGSLARKDAEAALDVLKEVNSVIAVIDEDTEPEMLPEEIEKLIAQRQEARKNRNFELADRIRDDLRKRGIILEDTRDGCRWRRL